MEEVPWLKYWIKRLEQDEQYGNIRLKILNEGFNRLNIKPNSIDIIDIVEVDEFIKIDLIRLPLFIGTQFGIYPRIESVPNFFNGEKVIAILGKSVLSGVIAGLSLYQIDKNDTDFTHNKIKYFENKP